MYNLRYHIASLVGVFLALALGLILGGLAVGSGAVERQQTALVDGLRKEFASLRDANADLESHNAVLEEFAKQANDSWSSRRLEGKTVAVVTNAGRTDGLQIATRDIEAAGGRVVVLTVNKPGLALADTKIASTVTSVTGDAAQVRSAVIASITAELTTSDADRSAIDALVAAGVLGIQGLEPGVTVDGLVDIAAPGGKADPVTIALAVAFAETGRPGMGAQTTTAGTGVAAAAADAGASGFDTLGTEVGRYTLIALLSGGEPGYFGLASGVDGPFPPLPEE